MVDASGQIDNVSRAGVERRDVRVRVVLAVRGDVVTPYWHPALERLVIAL
jgi:hypothetical protein